LVGVELPHRRACDALRGGRINGILISMMSEETSCLLWRIFGSAAGAQAFQMLQSLEATDLSQKSWVDQVTGDMQGSSGEPLVRGFSREMAKLAKSSSS